MIADIGTSLLICSFLLALWQAGLGLYGIKHAAVRTVVCRISQLQSCVLIAAFCVLAFAFLQHDFSLRYVAQHSHVQLPWIYCITAVWGGHEGSMLLWLTLLGGWQLTLCWLQHKHVDAFYSASLGVLGVVSVAFHSFILFTSNPFARRWPPFETNGQDLNPLLQDPGLVSHPPMLYMGYVGFAIVFAFACAKLLTNTSNQQFAQRTRAWTIGAWSCLTLGITLGSWWAYRVLGWGGWWFWDPVENASFMPWLAGTALLHVLLIVKHRNQFTQLAIGLSILTFALSLMGTFLVRSGILVSVHAFASDPSRGIMMLLCFMVLIGSALGLFIWRSENMRLQHLSSLSREFYLLAGILLLVMSMLIVLLGTLYPLILDAFGLTKLSIGPPYFNRVFTPFILLMIMCMGIAPLLNWHQSNVMTAKRYIGILLSSSVSLPLLIYSVSRFTLPLSTLVTLFFASWLVTSLLLLLYRHKCSFKKIGMQCAHGGFLVTILGVGLAATTTISRDVVMQVGESLNLGPYEITWTTLTQANGPNYDGQAATFAVHNTQGKLLHEIRAEKRIFRVDRTPLAKPGIYAGIWRDIYIATGREQADGRWQVRFYVKPFVRWIWVGGLFMMLGGILSLVRKRNVKTS